MLGGERLLSILLLLLPFTSRLGLGGCWYIICVILGDEVVEFVADDPDDAICWSANALCLRLWDIWFSSLLPLFVETTLWNAEFLPLPILVAADVIPIGGGEMMVLSILSDGCGIFAGDIDDDPSLMDDIGDDEECAISTP